jgi:hypothetical protein
VIAAPPIQEVSRLSWNSKIHFVFTRSRHRSLFRTTCIQPKFSRSIVLRSILILLSHLRPGFRSALYPLNLPTKITRVFIMSFICAVCLSTSSPSIRTYPNLTIFCENKLRSFSLCNSVYISIFSPVICFQNTFNQCSSLTLGDQISYPITMTMIIVIIIIIFFFTSLIFQNF